MEQVEVERVTAWLLSDDTGLSSRALAAHMLGVPMEGWRGTFAPLDEADRGRCVRLLQRFPEWELRLDELIALNDEWAEQIPLIRAALEPASTEQEASRWNR